MLIEDYWTNSNNITIYKITFIQAFKQYSSSESLTIALYVVLIWASIMWDRYEVPWKKTWKYLLSRNLHSELSWKYMEENTQNIPESHEEHMWADLQLTKMTTLNTIGLKDPIRHQFTKNLLEWQTVDDLNVKDTKSEKTNPTNLAWTERVLSFHRARPLSMSLPACPLLGGWNGRAERLAGQYSTARTD